MKIVNIVPGFGGTFYCGNCLRDSVFTQTLKQSGHEAVTLPIYLPLTMENGESNPDTPIFYGAVSIYLKQKFSVFRHMPNWMERFFNSRFLLNYAAKKAGSTRAEGMEEMTISMLQGSEGYQKEELQQLIDYLRDHEKPDVVHLSNALLLGLARKIRTELNIPVVCSLQDEDVWVDAMREKYKDKVWQVLSEKVQHTDAFIAVSKFFADIMQEKMNIPDDKLHIIPIGVEPRNYTIFEPAIDKPVVGYLSRLNDENGFEVLVDAFLILKEIPEFKHLKLRATGGYTGDDKKFIKKQAKKIEKKGYCNDFQIIKDFRTKYLHRFFHGMSVLSVPVLKGEAFGLYQLEALASGIPLLQPKLGAFPEIIANTKGGRIFNPNTPEALAEELAKMLTNKEALMQMSLDGRKAIEEQYNTTLLTEKMIQVYEQITNL